MIDLRLPSKPPVSIPRLKDAESSHITLSKEQDQQPKLSGQQQDDQNRLRQKRRIFSGEEHAGDRANSKRRKLSPQTSSNVQPRDRPSSYHSQYRNAEDFFGPVFNTQLSETSYHTDCMPIMPGTLRWNETTKTSFVDQADTTTPKLPYNLSPETLKDLNQVAVSSGHDVELAGSFNATYEDSTREHNDPEQITSPLLTRARTRYFREEGMSTGSGQVEKCAKVTSSKDDDAPNHTAIHELVEKHRNRKQDLRSPRRTLIEISNNMRVQDLLPHYTPQLRAIAWAKVTTTTKPAAPPPRTFMSLPLEIRRNIWDKVFEDEAYRFTLKKDTPGDDPKYMLPTPPPSHNCLFINKPLTIEVVEQMYKSMRVELDFGRLRPRAMREFMVKIGQHRIGREAQRVFFIKTFNLHKVNMGHFAKASEIVSSYWTVEGDRRMNEDDYLNNRIDPTHILHGRRSAGKLKGLQNRRLWPDQLAVSERYNRHIQGWCHPDSTDPTKSVLPVEAKRRPCPFKDRCLNLKDTTFCIVIKYKFGCIKGRHSRHKKVFCDYYPASGRLEQLGKPRAEFHRNGGKGGA